MAPTKLLLLPLLVGLPFHASTQQEHEIVPREWTPETLTAAVEEAGARVWSDGDVLTFYHPSENEGDHLALVAGDLVPMEKVGDLWTVSVRLAGLESMVLSGGVYVSKGAGYRNVAEDRDLVYRGPGAPPAPPRSTPLQGTRFRLPFQSMVLDETRELWVYLPPGHHRDGVFPVIYMTDGAGLRFAENLEALVLAQAIPPTILIGLPPDGDRGTGDPGQDGRAREYLFEADPDRFERHEEWFVYEVRTYIEDTYGASRERAGRLVAGCSNGAAFALSAARRNPHVYGHVIALSFGWQQEHGPWRDVPPEEAPVVHLAAGLLEPSFLATSRKLHELLTSRGLPSTLQERNSGHDAAMWQEEFSHACRRALGSE